MSNYHTQRDASVATRNSIYYLYIYYPGARNRVCNIQLLCVTCVVDDTFVVM